jgi:signal transduction histidine kinase
MGLKAGGLARAGLLKRMFSGTSRDSQRETGEADSKEVVVEKDQDQSMGNQRIKFDLFIHDLKVPLAVIEAGVISLLEREEKYGPLTEKQKKVLYRVLRNTKITKSLVNDAMEIGRANMGIISREAFAVSGLIEEALVEIFDLTDQTAADCMRDCSSLQALKHILLDKGIRLHIEERLWQEEVNLDESKMRQILRNLLNNALKYRQQNVDLIIRKKDNNKTFSITVSDDGQGIPQSYHKQIFECYFQMDMTEQHCVRGHGLGLAGVSVLVEDMHGTLSLRSDTGKGATFIVDVPL